MSQVPPSPINTEVERELAEKLIRKLTRKRVIGNHKKQIATTINWVATHEQGDAKDLLHRMAVDPDCPVEYYQTEEVIHLTSYEAAVEYVDELGGDTEWL